MSGALDCGSGSGIHSSSTGSSVRAIGRSGVGGGGAATGSTGAAGISVKTLTAGAETGCLDGVVRKGILAGKDGYADLLQDRFDLTFEDAYLFFEGRNLGL